MFGEWGYDDCCQKKKKTQPLFTNAEYKYRVLGEQKGVALLLCQAKGGPQQVNAFKTVPPFLGSWKRSYSFRMENGAEGKDQG